MFWSVISVHINRVQLWLIVHSLCLIIHSFFIHNFLRVLERCIDMYTDEMLCFRSYPFSIFSIIHQSSILPFCHHKLYPLPLFCTPKSSLLPFTLHHPYIPQSLSITLTLPKSPLRRLSTPPKPSLLTLHPESLFFPQTLLPHCLPQITHPPPPPLLPPSP